VSLIIVINHVAKIIIHKLCFVCCWLILFCNSNLKAQVYSPITLTGYNKDVIAEATTAIAKINTSMDLSNYVMYSQAFAASIGIGGSILNSGTIVSGTRTYQLAPFNGNNTFYVPPLGTTTITLATPASYSKLSLCAFASEGSCTATAVVHFTDGTIFNTGNIAISDWYNTAGFIYSSFGRVTRNTGPYTADGLPTNPLFYKYDINLSCVNKK